MFKKALITSFTTQDTELKLKVMKFIIDNDKLQCALYDHFYFDIKKFLIFMIENWDCSYKETFIQFINFIFKEYQRFLPELVDEFEFLYQIIFEEFYLQQELNVLISYFESFD
ncbi:hypothetical protein TUBRATIS_12160 [Tubulinosema ratisbonensis]|uniref:Uncharacterized protein n=1 Tax=Tubulinosema ratisbonensis TaxID=291195 RepID=A0A437AMI1_9MICR|nr:hypothetical protein TUBRATIS_12160 [Tubulinosema ratisbonensis]